MSSLTSSAPEEPKKRSGFRKVPKDEEDRAMRKQKVLFLCTQNSARSQMAEGFLRHHAGDHFEAYSAGCAPTEEIHPYAVQVMDEVGVDIRHQYPKGVRTYMGKVGFNYSIIVCARAENDCDAGGLHGPYGLSGPPTRPSSLASQGLRSS